MTTSWKRSMQSNDILRLKRHLTSSLSLKPFDVLQTTAFLLEDTKDKTLGLLQLACDVDSESYVNVILGYPGTANGLPPHLTTYYTPLQSACRFKETPSSPSTVFGNVRIVAALLRAKADPNAVSNASQYSPLCIAIMNNNIAIVQALIHHGAQLPLSRTPHADTTLLTLVANRSIKMFHTLYAADATRLGELCRSAMVGVDQDTLLHVAADRLRHDGTSYQPNDDEELDERTVAFLRLLVQECRLPVNALNAQGSTALHYAWKTLNIPAVRTLVELEADTKVRNLQGQYPLGCHPSGRTGLMLLFTNGLPHEALRDHRILDILLEKDPTPIDTAYAADGNTALHYYAMSPMVRDIHTVHKILAKSTPAMINTYNKHNETTLYLACMIKQDIELVKELLRAGADALLTCRHYHNCLQALVGIPDPFPEIGEIALALLELGGCGPAVRNNDMPTSLHDPRPVFSHDKIATNVFWGPVFLWMMKDTLSPSEYASIQHNHNAENFVMYQYGMMSVVNGEEGREVEDEGHKYNRNDPAAIQRRITALNHLLGEHSTYGEYSAPDAALLRLKMEKHESHILKTIECPAEIILPEDVQRVIDASIHGKEAQVTKTPPPTPVTPVIVSPKPTHPLATAVHTYDRISHHLAFVEADYRQRMRAYIIECNSHENERALFRNAELQLERAELRLSLEKIETQRFVEVFESRKAKLLEFRKTQEKGKEEVKALVQAAATRKVVEEVASSDDPPPPLYMRAFV